MEKELYQLAFNYVNSPLIIVNDVGCILAINSAYLDLFEANCCTQDDFIGKDLLTHPIILKSGLSEKYHWLLNGDVKCIDHARLIHSDDICKTYLNIHFHPLEKGQGIDTEGFILVHEDVSAFVNANESTKKARTLLDEVQEVSGLGVFDLDIPSQTAFWSSEFYRILEYIEGKDASVPENFLARIHSEDRTLVGKALDQTFNEKIPYKINFRLNLPNGAVRYVSERGRLISDDNGAPVRFLGTVLDITDQVKSEKKLKDSERELRQILENMQDTYYRTDPKGRVVKVSPSVEELLGFKVSEILGTKITDLYVDPNERARLFKELQDNKGKVQGFEAPLKRKDDSIVWVSTNVQIILDENGTPSGIEGTTRNITDKKLTELQMQKLSQALEQSADSVAITDREGLLEYVNPAFEKTTGYAYEEIVGKTPTFLKSGLMESTFYEKLWDTITCGKAFSDLFINKRKDGTLFYEQKTISPLKNAKGEVTHFVSTGMDITEFMESQERIQFLAHHDFLTELPNRAFFNERLEHALARAKRHDLPLSILFLDMDRFKTINDTLGHDVGDVLLKKLATRLQHCIREDDTAARLGGDEFAILAEEVGDSADISVLAIKLLDTIAAPFIVDGKELYITTSIGISTYPQDGQYADQLLRNADMAMYKSKEHGKNNYHFYSSDIGERSIERLKLENCLRKALERNEFCLFYQPQVNIRTRKIVCMEALIRWRNPELGLIMPADFIFLLEEIGMIETVGEWVIQSACHQLKKWHDAGYEDLSMSINLSSQQCNDPSIAEIVKNAIQSNHLDSNSIDLEITESMLMLNMKSVDEALDQLSELGVRVAIDDFGTGYSSLSYLKRFPIDILKIDRSFIKDIVLEGGNQDDIEIVKAIIAMGKALNLRIIAEGVENEEQQAFLADTGCDIVQGYLISKPLSVEHMNEWLLEYWV